MQCSHKDVQQVKDITSEIVQSELYQLIEGLDVHLNETELQVTERPLWDHQEQSQQHLENQVIYIGSDEQEDQPQQPESNAIYEQNNRENIVPLRFKNIQELRYNTVNDRNQQLTRFRHVQQPLFISIDDHCNQQLRVEQQQQQATTTKCLPEYTTPRHRNYNSYIQNSHLITNGRAIINGLLLPMVHPTELSVPNGQLLGTIRPSPLSQQNISNICNSDNAANINNNLSQESSLKSCKRKRTPKQPIQNQHCEQIIFELEKAYSNNVFPNNNQEIELSLKLGLTHEQVTNWFKTRRDTQRLERYEAEYAFTEEKRDQIIKWLSEIEESDGTAEIGSWYNENYENIYIPTPPTLPYFYFRGTQNV